MSRPAERTVPTRARRLVLVLGIVLIAVNLRASLTVVGPLVATIRADQRLSATSAGLLTTIPLLIFAAVSPLAPRLVGRWGETRTLCGAMVVLAVGTVLRSVPLTGALFAGTVLLAAPIAVANVVLPGVVKREFPEHVGILTGVYVSTMGLLAALASGVAVPLAGATPAGWRGALACWVVLGLFAIAVCLHPSFAVDRGSASGPVPGMPWRSAVAWQVTVFMGLQSLGFYVMITWLPSILVTHGFTEDRAGWVLFLFQLVALAVSLTLPIVTRRLSGQRVVAATCASCCLLGYLGLAVAPGFAIAWVVLAGLGGGGTLVLALSFMALRSTTPSETAALSGMAQSIGYLLAAIGPVLLGALHDLTHSWTPSIYILAATAALLTLTALGAGRSRTGPPRRETGSA
ncbi:CynX/NimT family MFS transporter [Pseudonocardia spinosispora]|uniref:CynX/NimT family MFS transporter n=1 Tax=Pseudonocardia spinosispora TaxID=103441 RepID=UPI000425743C|nr:MFS transporter [Pseudonocardia spinosispora]